MLCPNCNNQVNDIAKFCPYCGNRMKTISEKTKRIIISISTVLVSAAVVAVVVIIGT